MKNRSILEKLGDFVLGKGFYIVLFLCVATIGVSGYYLIRSVSGPEGSTEPVTGNPTVVLPDSQAGHPDPLPPPVSVGEDKPAADKPAADQNLPAKGDSVHQAEPEPAPKPAPVVYTWPVKGEVLRDFSAETLALDPTLGDWRTHSGMDIASQVGLQVLAICPGTVSAVYEDGLMGTTVVIDHGEGLTSTYCNLAGQPTVESGQDVETGTVIGTVGDTAIAESGIPAHLHLEVSLNGVPVDPADYLPEH